jgi:hypothetical protein
MLISRQLDRFLTNRCELNSPRKIRSQIGTASANEKHWLESYRRRKAHRDQRLSHPLGALKADIYAARARLGPEGISASVRDGPRLDRQ